MDYVKISPENAAEISKAEHQHSSEKPNPMTKIILMVGAAIVIFLAFIVFSMQNTLNNNEQLNAIKDLYFPVLERVDANVVRIDKMEELYLQAVMTGERDELEAATEIAIEGDTAFSEMSSLYPAQEDRIGDLQLQLANYNDLAYQTSVAFLEEDFDSVSTLSEEMNISLDNLRADIKGFRAESHSNFITTLDGSLRASKVSLYMSIAVGLMNLAFMGVLVFFIRNNMKMMSVIAEQNETLEHRVAERTAELSKKTNDINAMLNNMSLGVCTIVPGNKIHHEYSSFLKVIFNNEQLANEKLVPTLFNKASLGVDAKDQIEVALESILGEDEMVFDFNSHLLAREMSVSDSEGNPKYLQLDWSPICNERDEVEKVLLIVQDVTELKALEEASAHQKEELDIIAQVIKLPVGKFNEFIADSREFLQKNRKIIEASGCASEETVAALFRNMHTIKGNARTYQFNLITNASHLAEQEYDRFRKEDGAEWNAEKLLEDLEAVDLAVEHYADVSDNKLGRKGRASDQLTSRGSFVASEELAEIKSASQALATRISDSEFEKLNLSIQAIGLVPLSRLASGSLDSVASTAEALGKPEPEYEIVNKEFHFEAGVAQALKSAFMHIVRNSLDHGIELPEERKAAGKPEAGKIRFICDDEDGKRVLRISDDGRGLALHKLYEKGVLAGVIEENESPDPEEVAELIFNSGLSTAGEVSDVSGRGVGMDAVRTFLKEQGATIKLELDKQQGGLGFTPFNFVIEMTSETESV